MTEQFYTILTQIGKAKIANASALGQKVDFTDFALGDGGGSYYNPVESQTELKNEVWRGKVGNVAIDEDNLNWIVLENIIPSSIGGFMVREAGVFDGEGNLIAIGKYPETYKPTIETGSAKDLTIKMFLEVSNTAVVNLKIDPTIILATKKDIDVLSNRIKKNENDIKELKQGSTIMEDLQTENKTLAGAINEALDKANQAFQSASDGKEVIATAITGKGIPTSSSDTFQKMAINIDAIETDSSIGTTNATANDILSPKKAISNGELITGTIPIFQKDGSGVIIVAPTSVQTHSGFIDTYIANGGYIPANSYIRNTILGLAPANIKAGVKVGTDPGVVGTFTGIGSATPAHVLTGTTFSNNTQMSEPGTMPNMGNVSNTLTTQGGQYTIPYGFHHGGGVVKAQFANLVAGNVRAGVNIGGEVGSYEGPYRIINVPSKTYSYGTTNTPIDGIGGVVAVHPLAFTINGVSTSYSEEFLDGNYNGVATVTLQPRSANGVILPGITVTLSANNLKMVISGDRETQKITLQTFKMLVK